MGKCFPTSNTLKSSQPRSFNRRHILSYGLNDTPTLALCYAITLLSPMNPNLRVTLTLTDNTIPTAHLWRVKSANSSSVASRRRAWRRTKITCWRKKTPLCIFQASKTGIALRCSLLACQMIRLSGRANYTLSMIWDRMTIIIALSNAGVGTSSLA